MKNLVLFMLVALLLGLPTEETLEHQTNVSHELISGQWVDANSINRLKVKDLTEPHPFDWLSSHLDVLTCYKDGKPYFLDMNGPRGDLQQIDDYYFWSKDSLWKRIFRFNISQTDTLLTVESQFQDFEPIINTLTKIPNGTPCDFTYYPGKDLRSGKSKSYNHYYFKGQYLVRELSTNIESTVEIDSAFNIIGLPKVDQFSLVTYGEPLMLRFYQIDTIKSKPIHFKDQVYPRIEAKNKQYFVLSPQENGFSLHETNFYGKSSTAERRFKVMEKVYEFERVF